MGYDRFLIAPLNSGLEADKRPWLIPDEAFAKLRNAYNFRGRIRKRFGAQLLQGSDSVDPSVAQLLSRLRVQIDTTDGAGNVATVVPGAIFKVGQLFSIGDEIFTVVVTGTPGIMLTTGTATVHTYDTTTGAVVINGAAALTPVFFYPAQPVMGLLTYERNAINDESLYAFDTQFAYVYASTSAGGWERLGTAVWTGTDSDFFWGGNYRGANTYDNLLFVSNFTTADGMKYWNGSTWNNFVPVINAAGDTIITARVILPFKDRLILLNTIEEISGAPHAFAQRCRFSQNGDPTDTANGWREDIPGRGGYIDAPSKEAIISAEYLRDRLIVFFERSTWELVYTGNQVLPFVWQKINTELGAESTFSVVPFDKVILGIGNVGIHACNGANVERIDDKIPDEVFDIQNENEGVTRVYGIRDYAVEMVYWTFPSTEKEGTTFPNQVLVYNYKTGTWAINDDTITAFGYFQNPNDITWQSTNLIWEDYDKTWDSGSQQSLYRQVIAGNQEGFTFIVDPDLSRNSLSLQITDISITDNIVTFTVINHNLQVGDFIFIDNIQATATIPSLNGTIYPVYETPDKDTFTINTLATLLIGGYLGGGTLERISNIDIRTKQFNFYNQQGTNVYIPKIVFYVERTATGEITANVYVSSAENYNLVEEGFITNTLLGTSIIQTAGYTTVPLQEMQNRFWHVCYFQGEGENVQIQLTFDSVQIRNPDIVFSDFELNAMYIYAMKTNQWF